MKNYTDNDYALNKYSAGIVYRFADSIVEITLADYLIENPDKSESDFRTLKEISDTDYFERDRAENAQTKRNVAFDALDETGLCHSPSPEELFIGAIIAKEEAERHKAYLDIAHRALGKLTEVQQRRYLLHRIEGLTMREIAAIEGVKHQSIVECLSNADKKIKKILSNS